MTTPIHVCESCGDLAECGDTCNECLEYEKFRNSIKVKQELKRLERRAQISIRCSEPPNTTSVVESISNPRLRNELNGEIMNSNIKKSLKQITQLKNDLNETIFSYTVGPYPFSSERENDGKTYYMIESAMLNFCEFSENKEEVVEAARKALNDLIVALGEL